MENAQPVPLGETMVHCCVECANEMEVEVEAHRCKTCDKAYCVHFMKTIGEMAQCWVCGSEKRRRLDEVPLSPL